MPKTAPKLGPGARQLLKKIAEHDTGDGVDFESAPRGRWRMADTDYVVNVRTFRYLDSVGLIDVGNGYTDPVRLTEAGRAYLNR